MISTPSGYAPYADERHVGCLITVGERSFGPDTVKSIKLQYSASHTSEAVPGSELVFEVENSSSISGFFEGLDTDAEIAVSLIVGGITISMGSFLYAAISYKESDLVAQVTARDYMESLDDVAATDIGTWTTLSGAVAALLPGVDAEFSGTLGSTAVVRGYDTATSKREALRQLAQAACCSCWYTRGKKLRFASLAAGWQGADTLTGDRLQSWDMLSVDEPVEQVALTTNLLEKYFYYDSNDDLEENRALGSATIPANSTGWVYFDKPGEMLYVNGYDATDMTATGWWAQMGITLLESSIYGIKVKTPRGIVWATDPWKIYITGIEYGVTPTEYTSGTGSAVKALDNPCVPSDRAEAVAAWLRQQMSRREKYTVDYRCNPAIEIGDTVQIYDKTGASALATVCGISIEYDGGLRSTLTCVKKSAGKEPGELTISPTALTLDTDTPTGIITVTRAGDGAISAVSSDTEVATVTIGGSVDLPEGYTPLEYIEGDGTQYLDTGFPPDSNTRVVLDGQYLGGSSETFRYILGAMTSAQSNRYSVMYSASSGLYESNMVDATSVPFSSAITETARLHIDKNKAVCTINGETVTNADTAFTAPVSLCLFAMHTATGVSRILKHRIWACSVYDNGTLVRKLVPCKNASGVAGMYDQVNAVFYAASGSGDYIAGPELATGENIITVSSTGKGGTATITISVAESTYHLAPADATCRVTCNFTSASFADADWGEIIAACQSGSIPDTWAVGDSTTIDLDGVSYQVDIIGKNHDTYADGSGTAPLTFQLHDCFGTPSAYNGQYLSPNQKLWETCAARTDTLPEILELMPAEVQAAIRSVKKVCMSSFTAAASGKYPSTTLTDGLFLLSLYEVTGNDTTVYPVEGAQYAYYKAGNSKIKKLTASGVAVKWWTRTPTPITGTNHYGADYISATGTQGSERANVSNGIAPAWCF